MRILYGVFLLYSYYFLGVPVLGFPLKSLYNLLASVNYELIASLPQGAIPLHYVTYFPYMVRGAINIEP